MEIDSFKIKMLLAERKMTMAQLASSCSVTRQNISRILAKERCNPATAGKIADGLCVHVSKIVKGDC